MLGGTAKAAFPQYTPPKLERAFVFNPRFGPKEENADEKLLFYFPASASNTVKYSDIGLSEALSNVTSKIFTISQNELQHDLLTIPSTDSKSDLLPDLPRTFTDQPVETLRTLKCRWTLLMPEEGYWIGMVFRNATIVKKEGAEPEYLDEEINDLAIAGLLKRTYNTYKLFYGTFEGTFQRTNDVVKLREALADGFNKLLPTLAADDADLFGTLDGIHFLSVNKNVFLQIQSFVNSVESSFDQIKHTIFMHRDHLVWSGLEQEDMRSLYKYINDQRRGGKFPQKQMGFIMGPSDANLPAPVTLHIGPNATPTTLLIFLFGEIICMFIVDAEAQLKPTLFANLQEFMVPQLQFIGVHVNQQATQRNSKSASSSEDSYRYIYFNHMNLALKTTLKGKALELSKDIMATLNQMHADFEHGCGANAAPIHEVMIRTQANVWIVGKKSDQREFYVIFDQDSRNLLEVTEEVKKLSQTHFGSIFID